eukprot:m.148515 g.148515  ORF g.148515 m.148515 type:complete len:88 (+) comp38498_c1_seq36:300-563(+)
MRFLPVFSAFRAMELSLRVLQLHLWSLNAEEEECEDDCVFKKAVLVLAAVIIDKCCLCCIFRYCLFFCQDGHIRATPKNGTLLRTVC